MGNTNRRQNTTAPHSVNGLNLQSNRQNQDSLHHQINTSVHSQSNNFSGRSFNSVTSYYSSISSQIGGSRPWSKISRRRWKESTLTLPYEHSKTAWPVSQLESLFLPDFPVSPSVSETDFGILEEISRGAFGKVYKVQEFKTRKVFALKVLSKSQIVKEDAIKQVKNEVHIQKVCGHHIFIVNCPYYWQSRKRLFIVTEFVECGELYKLLKAYFILPIELVQLYVAEIALTIDFLHNAGIVHRDLKPENILLDSEGHIQLIDFGLAKWLSYGSKTSRVCGSLRYMAPEIVWLQPYGHAVDWWSLGVIACLMLTGQYPSPVIPPSGPSDISDRDGASSSSSSSPIKKPGSIPDGGANLELPSRDLLGRLLEVDPVRRLRSLRTLQTIAFYKGYNLEDVKEKKIRPNDLLKKHFPHGPPE